MGVGLPTLNETGQRERQDNVKYKVTVEGATAYDLEIEVEADDEEDAVEGAMNVAYPIFNPSSDDLKKVGAKYVGDQPLTEVGVSQIKQETE